MLDAHKELIQFIKNKQNVMVEQLHQFCSINSGTTNLEGLALMAQVYKTAMHL